MLRTIPEEKSPAGKKTADASKHPSDEIEGTRLEEARLIASVKSGDKLAFGKLVDKYHALVAGTVIGMLGHSPEAEDIGQETFLRFYLSLEKFRGDSSAGTYLTRIAMNLCLNKIRSLKRRSLWGLWNFSISPHAVDGQALVESLDLRDQVRRAVMDLEAKLRAVVVLRWMEGHSTEETSQILGIPMGTVLSRLHRSMETLRKNLNPPEGRQHE